MAGDDGVDVVMTRGLGAEHFLASLVLASSRVDGADGRVAGRAVLVGRRSMAARELVVRRKEASWTSRRVGATPLDV
jgi:hypothetical protein